MLRVTDLPQESGTRPDGADQPVNTGRPCSHVQQHEQQDDPQVSHDRHHNTKQRSNTRNVLMVQ
jgi:hypothetical protein